MRTDRRTDGQTAMTLLTVTFRMRLNIQQQSQGFN
jgi:hypothetical protein